MIDDLALGKVKRTASKSKPAPINLHLPSVAHKLASFSPQMPETIFKPIATHKAKPQKQVRFDPSYGKMTPQERYAKTNDSPHSGEISQRHTIPLYDDSPSGLSNKIVHSGTENPVEYSDFVFENSNLTPVQKAAGLDYLENPQKMRGGSQLDLVRQALPDAQFSTTDPKSFEAVQSIEGIPGVDTLEGDDRLGSYQASTSVQKIPNTVKNLNSGLSSSRQDIVNAIRRGKSPGSEYIFDDGHKKEDGTYWSTKDQGWFYDIRGQHIQDKYLRSDTPGIKPPTPDPGNIVHLGDGSTMSVERYNAITSKAPTLDSNNIVHLGDESTMPVQQYNDMVSKPATFDENNLVQLGDGSKITVQQYNDISNNKTKAYFGFPDGTVLNYQDGVPGKNKYGVKEKSTDLLWGLNKENPHGILNDFANRNIMDPGYKKPWEEGGGAGLREALGSGIDTLLSSAPYMLPGFAGKLYGALTGFSNAAPSAVGYDGNSYASPGENPTLVSMIRNGTLDDTGTYSEKGITRPQQIGQIGSAITDPLIERSGGIAEEKGIKSIGDVLTKNIENKLVKKAVAGGADEANEEIWQYWLNQLGNVGKNIGKDSTTNSNTGEVIYKPTPWMASDRSSRLGNIGSDILDNMGPAGLLGSVFGALKPNEEPLTPSRKTQPKRPSLDAFENKLKSYKKER